MESTDRSIVETSPSDDSTADETTAIVIGGVVAAVAIVLLCLLVVMLRYMYRHNGTYQTNEAKSNEFAESADEALKNDLSIPEEMDDSKKEYFI